MIKRITSIQEQKVKRLYNHFFSASEIAYKLGLSMSQVYDSLIRQNVKRRKSFEQNRIRFNRSPLSFYYKKYLNQKDVLLEASALMLYSGEGAKTGSTIDFANSDPKPLKVFLCFLRKICKVKEDKLRLYLYCFSNQSAKKLIKFWSLELKVKAKAFTKPYIRKNRKEHKTRTMPYGVLHIRYSDKKLFIKILERIDQSLVNLVN